MSPRLKRLLIIVVLSAIVLFLIKLFAFDFYLIEQMSMYKSISKGEQVVISKYQRAKIGDVILYEDDRTKDVRISRVVAKSGDSVKIKQQNLYLNNKLVKYKSAAYSYCFRFISEIENNALKSQYLLEKINNSGFYQVELTDTEFETLINDSLSELSKKLFPIENCRYSFFSEDDENLDLIVSSDSVFILNDNRSNLNDSRTFGLLPINKIIGRVIYVYQ